MKQQELHLVNYRIWQNNTTEHLIIMQTLLWWAELDDSLKTNILESIYKYIICIRNTHTFSCSDFHLLDVKVGWHKLHIVFILLSTFLELLSCTQQRWAGLRPHTNHLTILGYLLQVFLTLSIVGNHCTMQLHYFLSNDLPVFVELKNHTLNLLYNIVVRLKCSMMIHYCYV